MMTNLTLDQMESRYGSLWRFDTKRYTVACWAEEEYLDPADCFEDEADIRDVRTGYLDWFCAVVGVFHNGALVGCDTLGGCAYRRARDFVTGENRDSYFRDMVRSALRKARADALKHQFVG
jgi:hypothetical protein